MKNNKNKSNEGKELKKESCKITREREKKKDGPD
jgi:hypothetical protein